MRCPYCQQNIRVQGRFCPKCGEQIFGLPVRQQTPPTGAPAGVTPPATPPAARPAPPPAYRPFEGSDSAPAYDDITIETGDMSGPAGAPSAAPSGVHPAAGEEVGKTCPYCRFPLKPGEQVMSCPACKVPHHADCWAENQGCTTYGCQGVSAPVPSAISPPFARPTSVLSSPGSIGLPDFDTLAQTEFIGRANNALILAIIGLLCCAPLSLIGLFMGIGILSDLIRHRISAPAARSKAITAIVLGVVATLGWLIYLLIFAARPQ